MKKCDTKCIYYPLEPSEILRIYKDKFGVKHRECIYLCGFDFHRIEKYELCSNYKNLNRS